MGPHRHTRQANRQSVYPTAKQIQDAYSQSPSFFSTTSDRDTFPSSGSNSVPIATPEEIEARRLSSASTSSPSSRGRGGRRGRGREGKFMYVGGFRIPAPPLAPIDGMPKEKNKQLADELRDMLGTSNDEEESAMNEPLDGIEETTMDHQTGRNQYKHDASLLAEAYKYEYCVPHHPDSSKSRIPAQLHQHIQHDDDEDEVINPRTKTKSFDPDHQAAPQDPKPPFHLARKTTGGQEVGNGVIGSDTSGIRLDVASGHYTQIIDGHNGCDTPIYQFEEARRGVPVPLECLNPDLPPLAIEHPARMWNSLIHSMAPELQPSVKWEHTKVEDGGQKSFVANMTLALPPSHPALKDHPLAMTLPRNRLAREYIAVADLLGGVKRYSGDPRLRKADAQNTALVKCIADNAISWIYSPVNRDEIDVSMDDEDEDEEEQAPSTSDPITSPLNEDEILIEEPASSHSAVDTINGLENKDEENSQDVSSPAQCNGFSMGDRIKTSSVMSDGSPLDVEKDEVISCSQGSDMAYSKRHHTLELDDGEDSTPDSLAAAAIQPIEGHGKVLPHECTGFSYPDSWWCCDVGSVNWVDLQERLGAIFARAGFKHKLVFDVFRANPTADTSSQVSDQWYAHIVLYEPTGCIAWCSPEPEESQCVAVEKLMIYLIEKYSPEQDLSAILVPQKEHPGDDVYVHSTQWIEELIEICANKGIALPEFHTQCRTIYRDTVETEVEFAYIEIDGKEIWCPDWVDPDDPSIIPMWARLAKTLVKFHCEKECCKKPMFSKAELSEVDEE